MRYVAARDDASRPLGTSPGAMQWRKGDHISISDGASNGTYRTAGLGNMNLMVPIRRQLSPAITWVSRPCLQLAIMRSKPYAVIAEHQFTNNAHWVTNSRLTCAHADGSLSLTL